jgi:hypothetical protein
VLRAPLKPVHRTTEREVANLLTLPQSVNFGRIAFSPDGSWLGASDSTGRLHLFHAPPVAELDAAAAPVGTSATAP